MQVLSVKPVFVTEPVRVGTANWNQAISWDESCRHALGEQLYPLVSVALAEGKSTLIQYNMWTPNITPGKIVGMLLDGLSRDELTIACSNHEYLAERMVDACESLKEARAVRRAGRSAASSR
jgi:hypothetical protein